MFNTQQRDKLLELKKSLEVVLSQFSISLFFFPCVRFFIEYKYFLIVLFAPTIIVMLINPPFSEKKRVCFVSLPAFICFYWHWQHTCGFRHEKSGLSSARGFFE